MGRGQPTLPHHTTWNVLACHIQRMEGGRASCLLGAAVSICPNWTYPPSSWVHLETDWEQLLELYLEVYNLHRLPSSPPGELAIFDEISSVLPCHPQEEKGTPNAWRPPSPKGFHLPQNRLSLQELGRLDRQKLSQSARSTSKSVVNCSDSGRRDPKGCIGRKPVLVLNGDAGIAMESEERSRKRWREASLLYPTYS